jgi:NAD(P)-dependent dehydrogenase (short-subunit alcohol dehydrogenase family)
MTSVEMRASARRGKPAVITGGASGMGRALARRCAAEGMHVAILDVHRARLDEVAEEIPGSLALAVDVSQPDAVEAAARQCLEAFGPPMLLCANAGIAGPTGRRLWELTPAEWAGALGVNLIGVVNCLRSFFPAMLAAGEGHVVITASMAAVTARASTPVYAASKRAVLAVAESLYQQVERDHLPVGVSVLLPATVSTNFSESHDSTFDRSDRIPDASAPIDPAQVAEQVLDAVDHQRFYIFTHADSRKRIDAWHARIIEAYQVFDVSASPDHEG